jgi:signal peptidase I
VGLAPFLRKKASVRVAVLKPTVVTPSDELAEALKHGQAWAKKQTQHHEQSPCKDVMLLWGMLSTTRRFSWLDALIRALDTTPGEWKSELEALQSSGQLPTETPAGSEDLMQVAVHRCMAHSQQWLTPTLLLESLVNTPPVHLQPVVKAWGLTPKRFTVAKLRVQKKRWVRRLLFGAKEVAEVMLLMLVFLVVMREWIGEPRLIPSESMVPTLQVEDRVFIEKLSKWWRPYQRGDVLVFYPPSTIVKSDPWSWFLRTTGVSGLLYDKEQHIDVAYIKRLIGLPGDTLEVRPGEGVFINGKKLIEPYQAEVPLTCTQELPLLHCGPITIPPNHYFMLGDNRNASQDSRYWGFLPKERVVGRAGFILWPLWRWKLLNQQPKEEEPTSHASPSLSKAFHASF